MLLRLVHLLLLGVLSRSPNLKNKIDMYIFDFKKGFYSPVTQPSFIQSDRFKLTITFSKLYDFFNFLLELL